MLTLEEFAKKIDHTNLKPYAKEQDIIKTIDEAKQYNFRGVCIPPFYVPLARKMLENTDIKVITVVGFPLGYVPKEAKIKEAILAEEFGADEIDVVMNVSAFKSGNKDYVENELRELIKSVKIPVKVIIETSYLEKNEIELASKIVERVGGFCVKTNTGFGSRGVTIEDIRIIRQSISKNILVKASGGIRTAEFAIKLLNEGADILGTSSGVRIYQEYRDILKKKNI